jgi:hypothetical protein
MGHMISLLAQFPISLCCWSGEGGKNDNCSCRGNGYVSSHHFLRSKNTHALGACSACGHQYLHDGCHSSYCFLSRTQKSSNHKLLLLGIVAEITKLEERVAKNTKLK